MGVTSRSPCVRVTLGMSTATALVWVYHTHTRMGEFTGLFVVAVSYLLPLPSGLWWHTQVTGDAF